MEPRIRVARVYWARVESLGVRESNRRSILVFAAILFLILLPTAIASRSYYILSLIVVILLWLLVYEGHASWHYKDYPYRVRSSLSISTNGRETRIDSAYIYCKSMDEAREIAGGLRNGLITIDLGKAVFFDHPQRTLVYPALTLEARAHHLR